MHANFVIKVMLKPFRIYGLIFFFICVLNGCSDDILKFMESEQSEKNYWENNAIATTRFSELMYNSSDHSNTYERFKIVHISDSHISSWSTDNYYKAPHNLIQSIRFANQQELKINAIVNTGDFISNTTKENAVLSLKSFSDNFYNENYLPSFVCTGNHDANIYDISESDYMTNEDIYNILISKNPTPITKGNSNYYYSDVPDPQGGYIRFIALDMLDTSSGTERYKPEFAHFSQEQIDWLGNVALKQGMTDQHKVIVLTHYPFQFRSYSTPPNTYLCDGDFVQSYYMIPEIIEAFRNRSSLRKRYPNKIFHKFITVDFNFEEYTGDFICHLGGHVHSFTTFDIEVFESYTGEFPKQKMIICTNQAPTDKGVVYNRVIRKDYTSSSNSFNIYAIDTIERNIYITFFGAYMPTDNPSFQDVIKLNY